MALASLFLKPLLTSATSFPRTLFFFFPTIHTHKQNTYKKPKCHHILPSAVEILLVYCLCVYCLYGSTMLDSAMELITEAASDSLFMFCFCNLIIVLILLGSKPISSFDQETENHTALMGVTTTTTCADTKQETNPMHLFQSSSDVKELSNPLEEEADTDAVDKEDLNDNLSSEEEEEEEEDDDDDDELRRRFEEFIEKVNRGWKEERLRTYHLLV